MSEVATNLPLWAEWAKALGLPAVAVCVSAFGIWIAWWQKVIAKEKLKHDLFDKRYAVFMAFYKLLGAILDNRELDAELREANAARAQSPFLFDSKLGNYLEELHKEASRINTLSKLYSDPAIASPPERVIKYEELVGDRLKLHSRYTEMVNEFSQFLKLEDFSRENDCFKKMIIVVVLMVSCLFLLFVLTNILSPA
jgi:hypothetical protein